MSRKYPARQLIHTLGPLYLVLFASGARAQTAAVQPSNPNLQFINTATGLLCGNCTLSTYAAGTSTPLRTYTDSSGTTQNPPVIGLNPQGYSTSGIWLRTSCYKFVLANASGATVWSQDHICGPQAGIAALQGVLAGSTGPAQSGSGSVISTAALNYGPQYFGAKCDGSTDDTRALQAALNFLTAAVFELNGVCVGNVYVPERAVGLVIRCGNIGGQCGIKGKAGVSAPVLTVFAQAVKMQDLYVDCNSKNATAGILIVNSGASKYDTVQAANCSADAWQINEAGGPATTMTSTLSSGSTPGAMFTVANSALPGCTIGTPGNYGKVYIDYGTSKQEAMQVSGSGNTMKLNAPNATVYTHNSGASIICAGNNNNIVFEDITGSNSGGWGFNMFNGSDENDIVLRNPQMGNNALGGELLAGSVNSRYGGHSEGNTGPAEQLGDINGGSTTNGLNGRIVTAFTSTPFNDLENTTAAYNATVNVCAGNGTVIQFKIPSEYIAPALGSLCHPYATFGTDAIAFGWYSTGTGGGLALETQANIDKTGTLQRINLIPYYYYGTPTNLATECTGPNLPVHGCTGPSTNNAIVAQLNDPNGNPAPMIPGITRVLINLAHNCTTGCTLSVNGHSSGIASHFNYFNGPAWTIGYTAGAGVLDAMLEGSWVDMSQ